MVPLLSDTWSITELSQLLEGLEQFGWVTHLSYIASSSSAFNSSLFGAAVQERI